MEQSQQDVVARRTMEAVNQIFNSYLQSEQARYRYFTDGKSRNMYFWTTERINHNGKPRFVSGVYRHQKKDQSWTAKQKAGHARRKAAKARALRLMQKQKEKATPPKEA